MYSQDDHFSDAKDRRIGNVKDPIDGKNVVNKRFMQQNAIDMKGDVYVARKKDIKCIRSSFEYGCS